MVIYSSARLNAQGLLLAESGRERHLLRHLKGVVHLSASFMTNYGKLCSKATRTYDVSSRCRLRFRRATAWGFTPRSGLH